MSDPLDFEAREAAQRAARAREKRLSKQEQQDIRDVMALEAGRRLLYLFLQASGIDESQLRNNPNVMAHAAGWKDAGAWWLARIRDYCPEREGQMRSEARRDSRITDEGQNDE